MTEQRAQSIQEFCKYYAVSTTWYRQLRALGLGPKELHIGGVVRITPRAREEWERAYEKSGSRRRRKWDNRFSGRFTDAWVRATKGFEHEVQYAERLKKGLSLMLYVSPVPHQTKTWRALYYVDGRPRSKRIGTFPEMSVREAREFVLVEFRPRSSSRTRSR